MVQTEYALPLSAALSFAVVYFKQMAHHLLNVELERLRGFTNILLCREPSRVIASFAKNIEIPTIDDLGYKATLHYICIAYCACRSKWSCLISSRNGTSL
jgi:hypothetical protein